MNEFPMIMVYTTGLLFPFIWLLFIFLAQEFSLPALLSLIISLVISVLGCLLGTCAAKTLNYMEL